MASMLSHEETLPKEAAWGTGPPIAHSQPRQHLFASLGPLEGEKSGECESDR